MSYSIEYNGFTMDSSSHFHIHKIEGLSGAEVRVSKDYKTGGHGGNIWNTLYGFRDISIEGTINAPTINEFFADRQSLINAFSINTDNQLGITLWDDNKVYLINAKVVSPVMITDESGKVTTTDFRIELQSGEAFLSGDTTQSYDLGLASGGGTPLPSPVPSPVGRGIGGEVVAVNGGSVVTYPAFTFTGVVINPTIANTRTGQSFTVNTSLGLGDILVVDYTTTGQVVTKNGVSIVASFSGVPVYLQFGNNNIIFNASNTSESANCNISFYEKYLGI